MRALAKPFILLVERFYPDPFVFAILLTFVAGLMALGLTEAGPSEVLVAWGEGLRGLLTFMAQIALTLVTAHALAHTDAVRSGLARLGAVPRTAAAAYALVAFVAGVATQDLDPELPSTPTSALATAAERVDNMRPISMALGLALACPVWSTSSRRLIFGGGILLAGPG